MSTHVVAVDRAKARFFRVRGPEPADPYHRRALVETEDLIHPEAGMSDAEVFSDPRPPARFSRAPRGSHTRSFDDHRVQSREEADRRFARRVAERVEALAAEDPGGRWLVCAEAGTRGRLREAFGARRVGVEEVDLNVAGLTPPRILERLVGAGAIPPDGSPG